MFQLKVICLCHVAKLSFTASPVTARWDLAPHSSGPSVITGAAAALLSDLPTKDLFK